MLLFGDPWKTGSKQEGSMIDREPLSHYSVLTQGSVMFNKELIPHYRFSYLKFIISAVIGCLCMYLSEASNLLEIIKRSSEDI